MLSCGALQRSNNTYIELIMYFSESERDPRYAGLIAKNILKKGWGIGKKYHELKAEFVRLSVYVCDVCVCVCVCVRVWNINSFDIIAIIFKAYYKFKSPKKKGF